MDLLNDLSICINKYLDKISIDIYIEETIND